MRRTMRVSALSSVLAGILAALVMLVLGGCGVTAASSGTEPGPAGVATPTATATPTGAALTQGAITVTTSKAQFTSAETITVFINNGLSQGIFVADHQTRCSLVTLERQTGDGWQPVAPCPLMTPTVLVEIAASTINTQRLGAPGAAQQWPAGTYRVRLAYAPQRLVAATIIYSAPFAVV